MKGFRRDTIDREGGAVDAIDRHLLEGGALPAPAPVSLPSQAPAAEAASGGGM